jgi:hypothetical protein
VDGLAAETADVADNRDRNSNSLLNAKELKCKLMTSMATPAKLREQLTPRISAYCVRK